MTDGVFFTLFISIFVSAWPMKVTIPSIDVKAVERFMEATFFFLKRLL